MTTSRVPSCPACASSDGWIIDSPVGAVDRVRLDGSGVEELGLIAPAEGLAPLGRPEISCAACGVGTEDERLRGGILGAAVAAGRGRGPHPAH